ncbi:hypothetical protein EV424DRAFT_1643073 [Suillus variegatus]|nr:hypothetical protein EV424DRAFT_1643073 [Suillus variegatus]
MDLRLPNGVWSLNCVFDGNCTGTGNLRRVTGTGTAGYGRSVAILRLGAFTARACGACRVDSRWGVGGIRAAKLNSIVIPPLHPLIHCAHPLVSRAPSHISRTLLYIRHTLSHLSDLHPLIHRAHPLVHPAHLSHGSNPPSRASSARSHESESVDPRSSKSHADPSRCPPFAVGQSVDPRSGKSHADPSCCPPFADFHDVPSATDAMHEHPARASKFAHASTPCAIHICSSHISIR